MRSYGSMKSFYFPSKKGFTLYKSVIKHPVQLKNSMFTDKNSLINPRSDAFKEASFK